MPSGFPQEAEPVEAVAGLPSHQAVDRVLGARLEVSLYRGWLWSCLFANCAHMGQGHFVEDASGCWEGVNGAIRYRPSCKIAVALS